MSFRLCKNDDMVSILRDAFKANIVRVPKKNIQPLTVLSKKGNKLKRLGQLGDLLEGNPSWDIPVQEEPGTNVAGNKSSAVDVSFGVQILDGYLKAFGLEGMGFKEAFQSAKEVSFSFGEVLERYVDLLAMGGQLAGTTVQKNNLIITPIIKDPEAELLLVDSVLASKQFQVQAEKMMGNETELELGPLKEVVQLEDTKVAIKKDRGRQIGFTGEHYLTFAFSCVRLHIDPTTFAIQALQADDRALVLESTTAARVLVEEEPEMLDIE